MSIFHLLLCSNLLRPFESWSQIIAKISEILVFLKQKKQRLPRRYAPRNDWKCVRRSSLIPSTPLMPLISSRCSSRSRFERSQQSRGDRSGAVAIEDCWLWLIMAENLFSKTIIRLRHWFALANNSHTQISRPRHHRLTNPSLDATKKNGKRGIDFVARCAARLSLRSPRGSLHRAVEGFERRSRHRRGNVVANGGSWLAEEVTPAQSSQYSFSLFVDTTTLCVACIWWLLL